MRHATEWSNHCHATPPAAHRPLDPAKPAVVSATRHHPQNTSALTVWPDARRWRVQAIAQLGQLTPGQSRRFRRAYAQGDIRLPRTRLAWRLSPISPDQSAASPAPAPPAWAPEKWGTPAATPAPRLQRRHFQRRAGKRLRFVIHARSIAPARLSPSAVSAQPLANRSNKRTASDFSSAPPGEPRWNAPPPVGGGGRQPPSAPAPKMTHIVPLPAGAASGRLRVFLHSECPYFANSRWILHTVSWADNPTLNGVFAVPCLLPISRVMLSSPGDASQLRVSHAELPPPAAGEIRGAPHRHRRQLRGHLSPRWFVPAARLAIPPGRRSRRVGREALGPGVSHLHIGQRVAYAGPPVGSYSSARNLPAWLALPLPMRSPTTLPPACCCAASPQYMLFTRSIGCKRATPAGARRGWRAGPGADATAKTLGARVIGTGQLSGQRRLRGATAWITPCCATRAILPTPC